MKGVGHSPFTFHKLNLKEMKGGIKIWIKKQLTPKKILILMNY